MNGSFLTNLSFGLRAPGETFYPNRKSTQYRQTFASMHAWVMNLDLFDAYLSQLQQIPANGGRKKDDGKSMQNKTSY